MLENIILIGAGGHAQACIEVIEARGGYKIKGLVDPGLTVGIKRLGHEVLGSDEDLGKLIQVSESALICVGQIKTPKHRIKLFSMLNQIGYMLPTIIAPTAQVSPHASIGLGSIVMHGVLINAGANIGDNCIINTRSIVEHGVSIGNHCHISTGALINGDVNIGDGSFIGSGSIIKDGVQIGRNCIVGMGATVFSNVPDGAEVRCK